jgi:hypothetical protein
MRAVSSFEANLLRILHGFLGRAPLPQIQPLVLRSEPRPRCLSRDCAELVKDSLAKGTVWLLATRGGWRSERFLRNGQLSAGRLWQRTRPEDLGLAFSLNSLDFLMWITAIDPTEKTPQGWRRLEGTELTLGDRFLMFLAYQTLREIPAISSWLRRFAGHPLCRLAFPQDFPAAAPLDANRFALWMHGQGACLLEAMQHRLADNWIHMERSKPRLVQPHAMLALGHSQEQTLDAFLTAAAAAGRRDLARFLLAAAVRLLASEPPASAWVAALDVGGLRMADRAEVYRAATAFLRRLETLEAWQRHARGVSFLDEDYAASQLWKSDWDEFQGDQVVRRAHAIVHALDPLQV